MTTCGAEIEVRLLLRIVLLFLFTPYALPARLQWKPSPSPSLCCSPYPDDYMTIGQPSKPSDVAPCLYDFVSTGQASQLQTISSHRPSPSSSCSCNSISTGSGSGSTSAFCSCSTSVNQNSNLTVGQSSHSPLPTATTAGVSRGGLNLLGKIGIAIAVIVVSLLIFIAVFKALKKASHNDNSNDLVEDNIDISTHTTGQLTKSFLDKELNSSDVGIGIVTYTLEQLAYATDNFTTKVGKGGSADVYRANLPGDRLGAVKRAFKGATILDLKLFYQEVSILFRLRSPSSCPHLVKFIGLCSQEGERILVFEFISGGSLSDRLHKTEGRTKPLSWAARMNIAFQVAEALQWLHEEAKPPILHRDVKSANVLLEDDNCAKLADFGLSKLVSKNDQFTITATRGTRGYWDPQYVKTGRYSAKSDVYSFGVLLLELITGLKSLRDDDTPLAEWTQSYRSSEEIDRFMTIVDRNVIDHINRMELQNMVKIANLCLRDISEERPSMREIVNMMQETRNVKADGNLADGDEAPLLGNGNLSDSGQCYITELNLDEGLDCALAAL